MIETVKCISMEFKRWYRAVRWSWNGESIA